jgi:hypothetical protein
MNVILLGAVATVVGTVLGAPTLSAIIMGAVIGFARPMRAARTAAAAGAAAWGALLLIAVIRGDAIGALSGKLGTVFGLPGAGLIVLTMLYPAVLAASAARLTAILRSRRAATDPA